MLTVLCSRASCRRCKARTAGFHHSMTSQGAPMPRTRRPEARNAETSTNRGPAEPRAVPERLCTPSGAAEWCKQPPSLALQDRARLGRIEHERTGSRSPGRFQAGRRVSVRQGRPCAAAAGPGPTNHPPASETGPGHTLRDLGTSHIRPGTKYHP